MSIASSECIVTPDLVPSPMGAGEGRRGRRPAWTGAAGQAHPSFRFDVAVVGLGYVGLPTALAFQAAGRTVLGLDLSERRLADILVAGSTSSTPTATGWPRQAIPGQAPSSSTMRSGVSRRRAP